MSDFASRSGARDGSARPGARDGSARPSARDGSARPWQDPRFWAEPGADDEREARHELLADLLGAYVDDELPPETASQLDAHLVGCARCRRDVRLQLAVRGALTDPVIGSSGTTSSGTASSGATSSGTASLGTASMEAPVASAALRARVAAITATPPVAEPGEETPRHVYLQRAGRIAVLVGLALALVWEIGRMAVRPPAQDTLAAPAATVPLLGAALADYRRVVAGDLPGRARDLAAVRAAAGVPVEPLHADGLRLLGAWTTVLEGEPAAVLAYRWKDRLLVQYIVPEQLFFRSPATRDAAAAHHRLVLDDDSRGVVAWPVADAGAVLIGEGGSDRVAEALGP